MFSKIYEVDCFQNEFKEMTKERLAITPPYPRYQKWLIASQIILLAAFKEKNKSDYYRNIRVAQNRLKLLEK